MRAGCGAGVSSSVPGLLIELSAAPGSVSPSCVDSATERDTTGFPQCRSLPPYERHTATLEGAVRTESALTRPPHRTSEPCVTRAPKVYKLGPNDDIEPLPPHGTS